MGDVPGEAPQKTQITAGGRELFGSVENAMVDETSYTKCLVSEVDAEDDWDFWKADCSILIGRNTSGIR